MLNNIGEMFARYKEGTSIFVETGTYMGDGIDQAIEVGFDAFISCEFHGPFFDQAKEKYADRKDVFLYHGSSGEKMPQILSDITNWFFDSRCFFWLDAHDSFGTGGGVPMYEELAAIKQHHRNDHVIMIDDIPLYFGDGEELRKRLWEINPDYKIEGVDPGVPPRPDYCMVAYL